MRAPWDGSGVSANNVRDALGAFLQTYARWTWWLHVTPRQVVSDGYLRQAFQNYMLHTARAAGAHVLYLYCVEEASSRWHIHSCVALPRGQELDAERLVSIWRRTCKSAGRTQISRFDPSKEGARYVVKTNDWHIESACANKGACRRGGCKKSTNDIAQELVTTRPAPHDE